MTFGDVRDILTALPRYGREGYVTSEEGGLPLFPVRSSLAGIVRPERIFEFGAYLGYCLVAFLHGWPATKAVGWIDSELYNPESNTLCRENLRSLTRARLWCRRQPWEAAKFGAAQLVQIDGDHSYAGCMLDLIFAYRLDAHVITIDDYVAIPTVRQATNDFAAAHFLTGFYVETVNGMAVLERVDFAGVRPGLEVAGYPTLDLED